MRRSGMRRRVVRGSRRGRRRVGFSRGRVGGFRSRRMSLRTGPRTESKYCDTNGQNTLPNIGSRVFGGNDSLDMMEYTFPVSGGRVVPALLSRIGQGPAVNQRIGNRVFFRSIRFNLILNAAQLSGGTHTAGGIAGPPSNNFGGVTEGGVVADTTSPGFYITMQKYIRTTFRIVVFRDRMVSLNMSVPAAPVPPSIDDIFEIGGGLYTTANLNVTSLGRYQLLYDRKFTCDSDDPQRSVSASISLAAPGHYGAAGETDIREGALYWLAFATTGGMDIQPTRFLPPAILQSWRIQYTDR